MGARDVVISYMKGELVVLGWGVVSVRVVVREVLVLVAVEVDGEVV